MQTGTSTFNGLALSEVCVLVLCDQARFVATQDGIQVAMVSIVPEHRGAMEALFGFADALARPHYQSMPVGAGSLPPNLQTQNTQCFSVHDPYDIRV